MTTRSDDQGTGSVDDVLEKIWVAVRKAHRRGPAELEFRIGGGRRNFGLALAYDNRSFPYWDRQDHCLEEFIGVPVVECGVEYPPLTGALVSIGGIFVNDYDEELLRLSWRKGYLEIEEQRQ